MAITFVGSGTAVGGTTSVTYNFSSLLDATSSTPTLASGDFVLVHYVRTNNSDQSAASMTPSGYTAISPDQYTSSAWGHVNELFAYKFITSDTSVTLPATGASSDYTFAATIHVFRGIDSSTPLDVSATSSTASNGANTDPAAITPTSAGAWIVVGCAASLDRSANYNNGSDLSTVTNHFRAVEANSVGGSFYYATVGTGLKTNWSSGSFDPAAWSSGPQSLASFNSTSITLALRPVPDVPPRKQRHSSMWL
jgi:hypothetical protein